MLKALVSTLVLSTVSSVAIAQAPNTEPTVKLSIQFTDPAGRVNAAQVYAEYGQTTTIKIGTDQTYIARAQRDSDTVAIATGVMYDGWSVSVKPILLSDGAIKMTLLASTSELTAINRISSGGLTVELPQLNLLRMQNTVTLHNGVPMLVSVGSTRKPERVDEAATPEYTTLQLTANWR